jgi:hypothetical protein
MQELHILSVSYKTIKMTFYDMQDDPFLDIVDTLVPRLVGH